MWPFIRGDSFDCIGCIPKNGIVGRTLAIFDRSDFLANGDHGITEAIEFSQWFAFCRLNHQSACDWPTHCWRMEPVVNQSLGDIIDRDTGAVFDNSCIEDALMSHKPLAVLVEDRVGILEPLGDVVR